MDRLRETIENLCQADFKSAVVVVVVGWGRGSCARTSTGILSEVGGMGANYLFVWNVEVQNAISLSKTAFLAN